MSFPTPGARCERFPRGCSHMTFGSLFSGIGGMDLGLEWAGMECRWQVEVDPFCSRILAKHWPRVMRHGDIHTFTNAEHVDLIAGGFPCQPVSLLGACAGKRRGKADERWLWPEFRRVINDLRPRYVLLENVVGLLSTGLGDEVRSELERDGYTTDPWEKIGACCAGAPHIRDRVFLVAYLDGSSLKRRRVLADLARASAEAKAQAPEWQWSGGIARYRGARVGRVGPRQEGWPPEPNVVRVVDGISGRVDGYSSRNKGLGNSVVPQVAELIGRAIMAYDGAQQWHVCTTLSSNDSQMRWHAMAILHTSTMVRLCTGAVAPIA